MHERANTLWEFNLRHVEVFLHHVPLTELNGQRRNSASSAKVIDCRVAQTIIYGLARTLDVAWSYA